MRYNYESLEIVNINNKKATEKMESKKLKNRVKKMIKKMGVM